MPSGGERMVNVKSYVRIKDDNTEAWLYLCAPEDGKRYEKAEEAVSALEDAVYSLEECVDNIETAVE